MSKSSRTKFMRENERVERRQLQIDQKKAMRKMDKRAAFISGSVTFIVIIALAIYLCLNSMFDNGFFMKKTISVSSKNYSINNSMMSYFFYEEYRDFVNKNYDSIKDMGLDSSKSLKKQDSYYDDGTWYDHFMNNAEKHVKEIVSLAEEAKSNSIYLDENDKVIIDDTIERRKSSAKSNDKTELEYYAYMYGRGVTEKDIRACLELEAISQKYYDTLKQNFKISEDEYKSAYENNINKYSSVDIISYTFKNEEYENSALNASSYQEYKKAVCSDIIEDYKQNYQTDLDNSMVEIIYSNITKATYQFGKNEVVDSFAFKNEAKVGDVAKGTDDDKNVYCIVKAPYKDEYNTANIRLIYFSNATYGSADYAEKAANSCLKSYNSTKKTESDFISLAKENSEDYATSKNGGLYDNLHKNIIDADAEGWSYDSNRKPGDCEVVTGSQGCYLLYYIGSGLLSWKSDIFKDKFDDNIASLYGSLEEKYSIISYKKNLSKIEI